MNVLVLSINYSPEATGFAPHTAALCEHLAKGGHRVGVITGFPFAPYWSRSPEYRKRFITRERLNDVEITRVTHFIPRRAGQMLQRLLMEGTFCLTGALALALGRRPRWNAIVYVGAQPSIAMLARVLATIHRIPYLVKITDLAAQAAVDVGIIKAPFLRRILDKFEYAAYSQAAGASVLCGGFKDALIENGYPADRIRVIYNSEDLEAIRPVATGEAFRKSNNLSPDHFVVLYSGSMGIKQGLDNIVEASRLLKEDYPNVRWVLVGDGELKPLLQKLILENNLAEQVRLLPLQPETEMSSMFSSADVLLLNQLSQVKDSVIPGKLLTYMAAGKPVLAAINSTSQAAMIIEEAQGGILVTPEDPASLADAVRDLWWDKTTLDEMGCRSRQYAERHFDRKRIMAEQERFLVEIAGANRQKWG